MNTEIIPEKLHGSIKAISSKSHVHRLLIAAALAENPSSITVERASDDINATADCLIALGADIKKVGNQFKINPIKNKKQCALLKCGESGSTLRFLIPIAGALGVDAVFERLGRLSERPLSPLKEELLKKGQVLKDSEGGFLKTSGKLFGGEYYLPGNVSSQFITGLLFALPLCEKDSFIHITTEVESRGYIDLTLDVLKSFNIDIKSEKDGFSIKGNQKYIAPEENISQGDWSNSGFWLTAGAFSEKGIEVEGLSLNSSQGDKEILNILKKFGAYIEESNGKIFVRESKLRGTFIEASQIPDIVPEVALLGALAEGRTVITGAERLRIKECDRLEALEKGLNALGAKVKQTENGLIIDGVKELNGGKVSSFNDHRMAMLFAVAAVKCKNPVIIENSQAVKKSYPDFFEDFKKLNGRVREV